MPELPDITIYVERLQHFTKDKKLNKIRFGNPFFLRTAIPPIKSVEGMKIKNIERMGKRIIFSFDDELFLVLHLMIAGRLHWEKAGVIIPKKKGLAAFDFDIGSLLITEVSTQKRASLHLVKGKEELDKFDRKGLEVLNTSLEEFKTAITSESHTLKRTLTDPTILSGIGNAYSDEILHRAKLSPILLTRKITDEQIEKLFEATKEVLVEWTDLLRNEVGDSFPKKVTAFRKEMAVHGKFEKPCPVCGTEVQRIRYSTNETNYCPTCQTDGKLLADRALSRLLKTDWPRTLDELDDLYVNK